MLKKNFYSILSLLLLWSLHIYSCSPNSENGSVNSRNNNTIPTIKAQMKALNIDIEDNDDLKAITEKISNKINSTEDKEKVITALSDIANNDSVDQNQKTLAKQIAKNIRQKDSKIMLQRALQNLNNNFKKELTKIENYINDNEYPDAIKAIDNDNELKKQNFKQAKDTLSFTFDCHKDKIKPELAYINLTYDLRKPIVKNDPILLALKHPVFNRISEKIDFNVSKQHNYCTLYDELAKIGIVRNKILLTQIRKQLNIFATNNPQYKGFIDSAINKINEDFSKQKNKTKEEKEFAKKIYDDLKDLLFDKTVKRTNSPSMSLIDLKIDNLTTQSNHTKEEKQMEEQLTNLKKEFNNFFNEQKIINPENIELFIDQIYKTNQQYAIKELQNRLIYSFLKLEKKKEGEPENKKRKRIYENLPPDNFFTHFQFKYNLDIPIDTNIKFIQELNEKINSKFKTLKQKSLGTKENDFSLILKLRDLHNSDSTSVIAILDSLKNTYPKYGNWIKKVKHDITKSLSQIGNNQIETSIPDKVIGIENFNGSSCFMNAAVQALYPAIFDESKDNLKNTTTLIEKFIQSNKNKYNQLSNQAKVTYRFFEILLTMRTSKGKQPPISDQMAQSLRTSLGNINPDLNRGTQEDSALVIATIIQSLEETFEDIEQENPMYKFGDDFEPGIKITQKEYDAANNIVLKLIKKRYLPLISKFNGVFLQEYKCVRCGLKAPQFLSKNMRKVPIMAGEFSKTPIQYINDSTINDQLTKFPTDQDYSFECKTCQKAGIKNSEIVAITEKFTIPPKILILHLDRFKSGSQTSDKYNHMIKYNLNENFYGKNYELISVVCHHSQDSGSGHYTTLAKNNTTGTWYKANDSSISEVNNVIVDSAIILIYKQKV